MLSRPVGRASRRAGYDLNRALRRSGRRDFCRPPRESEVMRLRCEDRDTFGFGISLLKYLKPDLLAALILITFHGAFAKSNH
jgi:hypothetical protein